MAGGVSRGGLVLVELVRLTVVVTLTAAGFSLGPALADLTDLSDPMQTRLISSVLGALVGYIVGGVAGRSVISGVDVASSRLSRVDSTVMISAVIGATLGSALGLVILVPVLFFPGKIVTVPIGLTIVAVLGYTGGRIGAARGGDLGRFLGVRGRLQVASPSRGVGTKVVDSSALMDGRLVDVIREGFLDGTLVVPRFVLAEMQSMADVEDRRRRTLARRGLDAVTMLQDEHLVAIEISDDDPVDVAEVDAKLTAICRQRGASLVTVDANLARIAEISGTRVLNLNALAEALRPPVIPGDRVEVQVVRRGTEPGQGVGYLEDGSMVVIERAADRQGGRVEAEVTSIMQNRQGRMVFARSLADEAAS